MKGQKRKAAVTTTTAKTSSKKDEGGNTGKRSGGLFKFMKPVDRSAELREMENKLAPELQRKRDLEVYDIDFDQPRPKVVRFTSKSKKEVKAARPKPKYQHKTSGSLSCGDRFSGVKTYWHDDVPPLLLPSAQLQTCKQQDDCVKETDRVDDASSSDETSKDCEADKVHEQPTPQTTTNDNSLFPIFHKNSVKPAKKHREKVPEAPSLQYEKCLLKLKQIDGGSKGSGKQLIIDAGQKMFGAVQCAHCSMVYSCNDPGDIQQHNLHHRKLINALRFPGWKEERLCLSLMDGRIIKVLPSDPKYATSKTELIREVVDMDLGFDSSVQLSEERKSKLVYYLYVSDDAQQVVCCVIAEPITTAYRLLPSPHATDDTDDPVMSCSKLSEPVKCGVSRVWTSPKHRRRGYARKVIDVLRASFIIGEEIEIDQIAFSHPTPEGHKFAASYCNTTQFLTYHHAV